MDLGQDKSSGAYVFFFLILIFSKNFEETYKRPKIIDFNPSFFPFPANINIYKKTNNQNWLYIDIHEKKCNPWSWSFSKRTSEFSAKQDSIYVLPNLERKKNKITKLTSREKFHPINFPRSSITSRLFHSRTINSRGYNKIRELIEHEKVNRRWLVNRESRTSNLAGSADAARSAMLEASVAGGASDWPSGHTVCLWKREGVPVLAAFHAEGVSTLKTARVARLWTRPLSRPPARHGHQNQFTESCRRRVSTPFEPRYADIYIFLIYLNWDLKWKFAWASGSVFKVLL